MDFTTYENAKYLMTANNMAVGLNMPPALKSIGSGENEHAHGLPPHAPRAAFLVDEYPACPKHWKRSEGRTMSYFVPIKAEHGLWLDFNASLHKVTQHVAVVVSSQGVNAISRLPSDTPAMEQYVDTCPKHKTPFGPDRLCTKCGYKWPSQNYVTSAATPNGALWLDGFRSEDGVIRQYVFTKDQARSVAKAIIGEDRVFALGISFFLSKTQRPAPAQIVRQPFIGYNLIGSGEYLCSSKGIGDDTQCLNAVEPCSMADLDSALYEKGITSSTTDGLMAKKWSYSATKGASRMLGSTKISARLAQDDAKGSLLNAPSKGRLMSADSGSAQYCANTIQHVNVAQVEIAAGAKVNQWIHPDPNPLDFYYGEPTALIIVNYCLEEDAERIIQAGKVDLSGKETWPVGLKVGNP